MVKRSVIAIVVAVAGLLILVGVARRLQAGTQSRHDVLARLDARVPPVKDVGLGSPARAVAEKLAPAVVSVHVIGKPVVINNPLFGDPFFNDPMFRQFFGNGYPGGGSERYVPRGAGSGLIISPDGYILTDDHVVQGAARVSVVMNGKSMVARVVGTDPVSDIAVVKIDTRGRRLPFARFGDSDDVRVGDWAIAVGNPLDIGTTVTLGVISAVNRDEVSDDGNPLAATIQTDAAINPGNSGGPLADSAGRVIGIDEAILSPTGSSIGIGFAIPGNLARWAAIQLIEHGRIVRPYLGVAVMPLRLVPLSKRRPLGIETTGTRGLVVVRVYAGSPAAAAGIRRGDVIVSADGADIDRANALTSLVARHHPGDRLKFVVERHDRPMALTVTLRVRPPTFGVGQK